MSIVVLLSLRLGPWELGLGSWELGIGSWELARRLHRSPRIEFRFVPQRLLADRPEERLVFLRDHHDAAVADRVALAILFHVVADLRAAGDEDVAVDDRPPDAGVAADAHARHEDAV